MKPALRAVILGGFKPLGLGSDLIEVWDAERSDLVGRDGSNRVASWLGIKGGYNLAQGGSDDIKPVYSATSFGGGAGLTGDGVGQFLQCTDAGLLAALPAGAAPGEIWMVCQQDALPADTSTRYLCGFGSTAALNSRLCRRLVSGGVNRASAQIGDGASASSGPSNTSVDFSSRHVFRLVVGASATDIYIDNAAVVSTSVVPNTTVSRFRLFTNASTSPGFYHEGKFALVALTSLLSEAKASAMAQYCLGRRRL